MHGIDDPLTEATALAYENNPVRDSTIRHIRVTVTGKPSPTPFEVRHGTDVSLSHLLVTAYDDPVRTRVLLKKGLKFVPDTTTTVRAVDG